MFKDYFKHNQSIKPDGIVEHEQEPPMKHISRYEIDTVRNFDLVKNATAEIRKEEARMEMIKEKHRKIRLELEKFSNAISFSGNPRIHERTIFGLFFFAAKFLKNTFGFFHSIRKNSIQMESDLKKIIETTKRIGMITIKEANKIPGINKNNIKNYFKILEKEGRIVKYGRWGQAFYKLSS
jgi:hypothetical protein